MCTKWNLNRDDAFLCPSRLFSITKPTDRICIKFCFGAYNTRKFNLVHFKACGHKDNMLLFYPLFSPLQVAQHVSGNYVPIFRSWRLNSVSSRVGIVPWLQEGCQNRLAGSVSIVDFVTRTPEWTHYLLTGSDRLPATTAQYQHVAITLFSRQLLKMGT